MSDNRLVQLMVEARALIPEGRSLHVSIDKYTGALTVDVSVHGCTRAEAERIIHRFGLFAKEHYYTKRPKALCLEAYSALSDGGGLKINCYVQKEPTNKGTDAEAPANQHLSTPASLGVD